MIFILFLDHFSNCFHSSLTPLSLPSAVVCCTCGVSDFCVFGRSAALPVSLTDMTDTARPAWCMTRWLQKTPRDEHQHCFLDPSGVFPLRHCRCRWSSNTESVACDKYLADISANLVCIRMGLYYFHLCCILMPLFKQKLIMQPWTVNPSTPYILQTKYLGYTGHIMRLTPWMLPLTYFQTGFSHLWSALCDWLPKKYPLALWKTVDEPY